MNNNWEDYYGILQVHSRAGNEIITGAYRLLSKIYHPDINKTKKAEDMMKRINIAYSILSDKRKRAQYDVECSRRARGIFSLTAASGAWSPAGPGTAPASEAASPDIEKAFEQIVNYYRHIKNGDFDAAYECISTYDKSRIKKADFSSWREAVAKTSELRSFEIEFYKKHNLMRAPKKIFNVAYEFTIKICERDVATNNFTDNKTTKTAVCENGVYGVYLGYSGVKPFIAEYKRRGDNAVDAKAMLECWTRDQALHDQATGMLNLEGFLEAAETEVSRYKRHGSVFSIAVFEARRAQAAQATGAGGGVGSEVDDAGDAGNGASGGVGREAYDAGDASGGASGGAGCEVDGASDSTSGGVNDECSDSNVNADRASCADDADSASSNASSVNSSTHNDANSDENNVNPYIIDGDIIAATGKFLAGTLRDIDISCHWKDKKFVALLAATDAAAARKAVNRIQTDFNKLSFVENETGQNYALYASVREYDARSLTSTIKKCALNLAIANLVKPARAGARKLRR